MAENNIGASQRKIYSYFESDPELRVLFIFNEPFLKAELYDATWKEGYRYVIFEDNWFTCKYCLDKEWAEDKVVLYFDMPSPIKDRTAMEKFPLMDVLVANKVFHHEDYIAFMQANRLPENMAEFVNQNVTLLQSDKMMKLLQTYYLDGSINEDVATRGLLSMFLSQQKVLEWDDILIRVLLQGRSSESDKRGDFYKKLRGSKMIMEALDKRVSNIFGAKIDLNSESKVDNIVKSLKYNAIVQNLALSQKDDYKTYRINNSLALEQLNRILEQILSQHKLAVAFEELMNELGATIRCDKIVDWYGADAKYYYIPKEMCAIILKNVLAEDISDNPQKIMDRMRYLMTKSEETGSLSVIMDFIANVGRYYEKASSLASAKAYTPNDYILFYENEVYQIDQLYRCAINLYYKISPSESLFEDAQVVKKALDFQYAKTTNRVNLAWTECLSKSGGLSSLRQARQWNFYNSQIKPVQKKVAVIVCDALRYELAKQLIDELAKSKHKAYISSAIATLPTETKFCKPSLFPYKNLKLADTGLEQNMKVDGEILSDTGKRSSHLQSYKDGAICVKFEDIAEYDSEKNREIFKHPLVYIFHNNIDECGHSNLAKQIVNGCSQAIKDIATMIPKIHSSCNVTQIFVTSDHGFLFNDIPFEEKDKQKVTEEALEQKTRYYLTTSDATIKGVIKFPLNEVSGMNSDESVMVAVPTGTNRFAAPSGGYMFAHGGASLQELLIPIIVSIQERTNTKDPVGLTILDRRLSVQASRLRFTLLQTDAVDMDKKERVVTVALYHNDDAVTPVKTIRLDKTDLSLDKRQVLVDLTLNKNVDAKVLQLKIYDTEDENNPLVKENVTNNTLIENDFDF